MTTHADPRSWGAACAPDELPEPARAHTYCQGAQPYATLSTMKTRLGLSNSQFAEAVGCDITTASKLRNGRRRPGVELLENIRQLLDISQDEIMEVWGRGDRAFGAFLRKHVFRS